jgi:prolyl-tRNA synthetase
VLGPTHEEEVCSVLGDAVLGARALPLLLYQITSKFRNEARPRSGLVRGREFTMKDLYSFDADEASARLTLAAVEDAYAKIFRDLQLPVHRATASNGAMGGSTSNEWAFLSANGEDTVVQCRACSACFNSEVLSAKKNIPLSLSTDGGCPSCGDAAQMAASPAIELAHTFLLGDRYSREFGVRLPVGAPAYMGCYGIGVSRLLAVVAAHNMSPAKKGGGANAGTAHFTWPARLAPFRAAVASVGHEGTGLTPHEMMTRVHSLLPLGSTRQASLLWDDRDDKPLRWRLRQHELLGLPFTLVLGRAFWQGGNGKGQPERVDVIGHAGPGVTHADVSWEAAMNIVQKG